MFTSIDQYQINLFNPTNQLNTTGNNNTSFVKRSNPFLSATFSDTPTIITENSSSLDSINEMDNSSYINIANNNNNTTNTTTTEQRLKEIEDYYLKSLLNDDNTNTANNNNNNNITQNNTNTSIFNNNNFYTTTQNNNSQTNSIQNGYQIPQHYINNTVQRRNTLEVDINNNFNHSLPLTTENLEKLSLVNTNIQQQQQQHNNNNILLNGNNNLYNSQLSLQQLQYQQQIQLLQQQQAQVQVQAQAQAQAQAQLQLQQQLQNQNQSQGQLNEPIAQQQEINKQLYKTELCESFTTKGFCKYGDKCQFAHGFNELKFKQRANNFRTKPCINWEKLGYCPYGKRCLFKHGDNKDIQLYVKAGTLNENDETSSQIHNTTHNSNSTSFKPRRKNLHANVKKLQKITW